MRNREKGVPTISGWESGAHVLLGAWKTAKATMTEMSFFLSLPLSLRPVGSFSVPPEPLAAGQAVCRPASSMLVQLSTLREPRAPARLLLLRARPWEDGAWESPGPSLSQSTPRPRAALPLCSQAATQPCPHSVRGCARGSAEPGGPPSASRRLPRRPGKQAELKRKTQQHHQGSAALSGPGPPLFGSVSCRDTDQ